MSEPGTFSGGGSPHSVRTGHVRLVANEIDHLDGMIYKERMQEGLDPIPVTEYRCTGMTWSCSGRGGGKAAHCE